MKISEVLIIYFVLFLFFFTLFVNYGKSAFSSFSISLVICLVYIYLIYPPCLVDEFEDDTICVGIYCLITIVSITFCTIYTLYDSIKLKK